MPTVEYVQYGCGWCAPNGWRNFDASPTVRFERLPLIGKLYTKNETRFPDNVEYGDISVGLPVAPGSCAAVYCSHVLEHLSLADFRQALVHTRRILRAGGTFRLVLPDLETSVHAYIKDPSPEAALKFMKDTLLGCEARPKRIGSFVKWWFGHSQHLWMWDFKSLELELLAAGFANIRRARFGDSVEPKFKEVEDESRWVGCLGVECARKG